MSEGNVSGWLAGSAAAITAVGGLIAIFAQVGWIGGDDDAGTTTSPTATGSSIVEPARPADWAAQANVICEQANDDIDALPQAETVDATQLASAGAEALDIGQRQLRELAKLTPPEDDAPKVKRLLRLYAQVNDITEEMLGALRVGDVTTLQSRVDALKPVGKASDDLANQLGATTCAEGASFVGTDLGGS